MYYRSDFIYLFWFCGVFEYKVGEEFLYLIFLIIFEWYYFVKNDFFVDIKKCLNGVIVVILDIYNEVKNKLLFILIKFYYIFNLCDYVWVI